MLIPQIFGRRGRFSWIFTFDHALGCGLHIFFSNFTQLFLIIRRRFWQSFIDIAFLLLEILTVKVWNFWAGRSEDTWVGSKFFFSKIRTDAPEHP